MVGGVDPVFIVIFILSLFITSGAYGLYLVIRKMPYRWLRVIIVPLLIIILFLAVNFGSSYLIPVLPIFIIIWLIYPLLIYLIVNKLSSLLLRLIIQILAVVALLALITPTLHNMIANFIVSISLWILGIVITAPVFERLWGERKKTVVLFASIHSLIFFLLYIAFSADRAIPKITHVTLSLPFNLNIIYSVEIYYYFNIFLELTTASTIFYMIVAIIVNAKPLFNRFYHKIKPSNT